MASPATTIKIDTVTSTIQHLLCDLGLVKNIYAGLYDTICRPDLSVRQYPSTNGTCTLTTNSQPIHENKNWPDSENLLQCNRFLSVGTKFSKTPPRQSKFIESDVKIQVQFTVWCRQANKSVRAGANKSYRVNTHKIYANNVGPTNRSV